MSMDVDRLRYALNNNGEGRWSMASMGILVLDRVHQ
jgi:hypothetical protein